MAIRLTWDLAELWQDLKDILSLSHYLWTTPKEAPPAIRSNYKAAFMPVLNSQNEVVGCFVPELYELAKVNGLINQDPNKTAFELAVQPVRYSDNDKKSALELQKRIEAEFNHRIDNGLPLPPTVFKYQVQSDYLKNLNQIGLKVGGPRDIALNLINPADRTTKTERAAHYMAQRAALGLTLVAVLSLTPVLSPLMLATALGVVLAKWCGEEFFTFDLAETLMRDLHSNLSRDFALGDKISVKKTIKTAVLLSALGVAAYGAFFAGWAGIMGLPVWNAASATITNATVLTASQYAMAGFVSALAGLGTLVGGTVAQRFFWGLGIWDKQIDFSNEKAIVPESSTDRMARKLAEVEEELAANASKDTVFLDVVAPGLTQLRTALNQAVVNTTAEEKRSRPATRSQSRAGN